MRRLLYCIFILLLLQGVAVTAGEQRLDAKQRYSVIINHEEQYSIWPANAKPPARWKRVDFVGNKESALDYIEEVWTDMRPLSKRRELALQIYEEQKKNDEISTKRGKQELK